MQTSVAPDHSAVYAELSRPTIFNEGPGYWKFNNALLDDQYVKLINDIYTSLRKKHNYIEDKRIFWEMFKMEIRSHTISFAKRKARVSSQRELEVRELLMELDDTICNSNNLEYLDQELRH